MNGLIHEVSTVPTYYLAKPQPRERAWDNQRGKKTPESPIPLIKECSLNHNMNPLIIEGIFLN